MNKIVRSGMIILTASLLVTGVGTSVYAASSKEVPTAVYTQTYDGPNTTIQSFASTGSTVLAGAGTFKDLPATHWAYDSVKNGVDRGYIGGYSDGTFKPSANVTRAEFIKMVAGGFGLKLGSDTSKWYLPALAAVKNKGWTSDKDYTTGNYNTVMTRLEMSKLAVRAIGSTATTDAQYMLIATQKGIITGVNKGELAPSGKVDRAQAAVIMQRILTVANGGSLKPDEAAVAAATDWVGAKKDAWGHSIRTTNLPKNASNYAYILQYMPNAAYEMGNGPYGATTIKPIDLWPAQYLTTQNVGQLKANIESFFNVLFNVDYRTINYDWATKLFDAQDAGQYSTDGKSTLISSYKEYVDFVKENKLVTKGTFTAEPSTIRSAGFAFIKVYYEYQVVSGNRSAIVYTGHSSNSIFRGQTDKHSVLYSKDYKLGQVIKVVSEIEIGASKGHDAREWETFKVAKPDLSANFVIVK